MVFSFWNIIFILEIFVFLYYSNKESDDVIKSKTLNQHLQNYWSSVLQTWHQK